MQHGLYKNKHGCKPTYSFNELLFLNHLFLVQNYLNVRQNSNQPFYQPVNPLDRILLLKHMHLLHI